MQIKNKNFFVYRKGFFSKINAQYWQRCMRNKKFQTYPVKVQPEGQFDNVFQKP